MTVSTTVAVTTPVLVTVSLGAVTVTGFVTVTVQVEMCVTVSLGTVTVTGFGMLMCC